MSRRKSKAARRESARQPAPARRRWLGALLALAVLAGGAWLWRRHQAPALVVPDPPTAEFELPVQEIIAEARKGVCASPDSAAAWGWYAAVLDAHHLLSDAEPCYRRAHDLDPGDVRYTYNLAILLEVQGTDPERSLELYRQVVQKQPKFAPVFVRIAHDLTRKGELEAALDAYQTALTLEPALWVARRALGQIWIELEQYGKALVELERVASAMPTDGPTQAALAQAYAAQGDVTRASAASARARALRDVLTLPDPIVFQVMQQGRSARLASERADARAVDGDYAGVVEDLKFMLRARGAEPKVHERLAEAYEHLGQTALAEEERAEARRLRSQK